MFEFEWDPAKAAANEAEHGITFDIGCEVFKDRLLSNGSTTGKTTAKTAT